MKKKLKPHWQRFLFTRYSTLKWSSFFSFMYIYSLHKTWKRKKHNYRARSMDWTFKFWGILRIFFRFSSNFHFIISKFQLLESFSSKFCVSYRHSQPNFVPWQFHCTWKTCGDFSFALNQGKSFVFCCQMICAIDKFAAFWEWFWFNCSWPFLRWPVFCFSRFIAYSIWEFYRCFANFTENQFEVEILGEIVNRIINAVIGFWNLKS